jgi:hypothetical protein
MTAALLQADLAGDCQLCFAWRANPLTLINTGTVRGFAPRIA